MDKMRLSIHGSRSLGDERVKIIILETIEKYKPSVIVTHGEPDGVCSVARDVCREFAIPLKLHYLNFKYLKGAFEHRSIEVINDCTHCLFIHDGESKGTSNEMVLAKKKNKKCDVFVIEKSKYKKSVGFDNDWDSVGVL